MTDLERARDPTTPCDQLVVLGDRPEPEIQRAVVANFATPDSVLITLGNRWPRDAAHHPRWPSMLAEPPALWAELRWNLRLYLATGDLAVSLARWDVATAVEAVGFVAVALGAATRW
jgi:hypothetical protein